MKFDMICIKFDQKIKNLKNPNFGLLRFFRFLKKTFKNLGFFRCHFPALFQGNASSLYRSRVRDISAISIGKGDFVDSGGSQ